MDSDHDLNSNFNRCRILPAPCDVAAVASILLDISATPSQFRLIMSYPSLSSQGHTMPHSVSQVLEIRDADEVSGIPHCLIDIMSSSVASGGGTPIEGSGFSHPRWLLHNMHQASPCHRKKLKAMLHRSLKYPIVEVLI